MSTNLFRNETEPIFARLDQYRAEFARHPLFAAARAGELAPPLLLEFAFHQYADSILWIPMLALMKSKAVRSARLRRAIEDNIACEAGLGATSHVQLAADLMRSLGLSGVESFCPDTFVDSASLWLSAEFSAMSEPEVAGWLLVAETLVPIMFAGMRTGFEQLGGCDVTYFSEHVAVDCDEHSAWMSDAVVDVIAAYGPEVVPQVIAGMEDAWQETLELPDHLEGER